MCRASWTWRALCISVEQKISIQATVCWQYLVRNGEKVELERFELGALWSLCISIRSLLVLLSIFWKWSHLDVLTLAASVIWKCVTEDFCPKINFISVISCNAETALQTVVNPAPRECPQRIMLISIFIEMLSKPLRETHSNQCCYFGSVLQKQVLPLLLLLFVLMPFTLIPLKGRWWSHTSIIPAQRNGSI